MDYIKAIGKYTVESENILTGEKTTKVFYNTLTNLLFQALYTFLNEDVSSPAVDAVNVTHIAVGTGTNASSASNTTLQTETYRKADTDKGYNSQRFYAKIQLEAGEANPAGGFIREVGCFAKATDTTGSGLMLSRANVTIAKNENVKLIITWEVQFQQGVI